MNEIKPMTIVAVAIMPDGTPRMSVSGRGTLADVLLAAKVLELEAASGYDRMKMAQAIEKRSPIVQAPAGAVPNLNGNGG